MKPHKHAALIKAWADNPELVIQFRGGGLQSSCWYSMVTPDWSHSEVRIKPVPKPDYSMISFVYAAEDKVCLWPKKFAYSNYGGQVEFIFDGETGELKDVQMITK